MSIVDKSWLNKDGELTIPNGIEKIEEDAFSNNLSITKINIPNSVIEIGARAFSACRNLKNIKFGNNISVINENAFSNCENLKSIHIPESIQHIGEAAFAECENLESVYINPNADLLELSDCIFYKCRRLKKTSFPHSLKIINQFAFANCESLKNVNLSNKNELEEINQGAFLECENLETVSIPNKVDKISESAFANCTSLKNINFENNSHLTLIEKKAFQNCISLEEITIPDTVDSIDEMAFYNCKNLTSITLPDYLDTIKQITFANCTNLTNINFNHNLEKIENGAFYNCESLQELKLPNSLENIEICAFANCSNIKSISGGKHIKEIGPSAFLNCNSIKTFEFPHKVKHAENIFENCTGIEEIKLGNYTENISSLFARQTYNLKKISLNEKISYIPDLAFYDCNKLEEITINGLNRINYGAFKNKSTIKTINIDNHKFKLNENEKLFSLQRYNEKVAIVYSDTNNILKTKCINLEKGTEKILNTNIYLTNNGSTVRAINSIADISINNLKYLKSKGEKEIYLYGALRNIKPNEYSKNAEFDLYKIDDLIQIKNKILDIKNQIILPSQFDNNREKKIYSQIANKLSTHLNYDFYSIFNGRNTRTEKELYEKYTSKSWDNYYKQNKNRDLNMAHYQSSTLHSLLTGSSICVGNTEVIRNISAEFGIESNTVISQKHSWNQVKLDGVWYNDDFTNYQIPLSRGKTEKCKHFLCGEINGESENPFFNKNTSTIYTKTHKVGMALTAEEKNLYLSNKKINQYYEKSNLYHEQSKQRFEQSNQRFEKTNKYFENYNKYNQNNNQHRTKSNFER